MRTGTAIGAGRRWKAVVAGLGLPPRDRDEAGRNSTNLELLFDLATVIAVAAAAIGLAQDVRVGNLVPGVVRFLASFFMAWLAWSNYTWFASGYDNRSTVFRALSIVIMFGSLTLAAGVQGDREGQPIWLALIGFTVMRAGLIALWLAAAIGDPHGRPTALRYAAGVGLLQVYWHALITEVSRQDPIYLPLFALGAAGELIVPLLAKRHATTSWNHDHIIDRYRSFNIIVLGECFAAITAIIAVSTKQGLQAFWLAGLCATTAFAMWRLYFGNAEELSSRRLRDVIAWAYGHFALFAAGAATAAGFLVCLAELDGRSRITPQQTAMAVGIPVALYLMSLWLVRDRRASRHSVHWVPPLAALVIVLVSALSAHPLELIAALLVGVTINARADIAVDN